MTCSVFIAHGHNLAKRRVLELEIVKPHAASAQYLSIAIKDKIESALALRIGRAKVLAWTLEPARDEWKINY
jgi:hypothetical protein